MTPPPSAGRGAWALLAAPPLAALLCLALAPLLPADEVWPAAIASGLWSAPPWLGAVWALIALRFYLYHKHLAWPAACAAAGVALTGMPLSFLPDAPAHGLVIVSANVNAYSPDLDPAPMEAALGALGADVVLTFEKRALHIPGMTRVADNLDADLPAISHVTALFCRDGLRCDAVVTEEIGTPTWKMPVGLIRLDASLCILAVHGPPPAPVDARGILAYAREVAGAIADGRMRRAWGPCRAGDGALVVGDLNAVPGSPAHRILAEAGLRDALAGTGMWGTSWPAGGGWPNLPFFRLDQVLAGAVEVGGIRHQRIPGTDHLAIVATAAPRGSGR